MIKSFLLHTYAMPRSNEIKNAHKQNEEEFLFLLSLNRNENIPLKNIQFRTISKEKQLSDLQSV